MTWVIRLCLDQIPRFRTARIKRGLESLDIRPETLEKILGGNAERFLGLEVK